ncbi:MAG: type II toxin-antitoxin system death-on-curing family toxin [Acetobacterales bacterium]
MPSGRRHYRITLSDVWDAHDAALAMGGGRPGTLNPALIESAIGRPYVGYHRSIESKAAALVQSMATNHGFADGNKRTTVVLMNVLLERSGYRLQTAGGDAALQDEIEAMVLGVIDRSVGFDALVGWFRERVRRA